LLIEVIDSTGPHWFRGKENQVHVNPEQWQTFHNFDITGDIRQPASKLQNSDISFLEVHYLGARHSGHEVMVLRSTILPSGSLTDFELLTGPARLLQDAVRIVNTWTLAPRVENGIAVSTPARIELHFEDNDVYVMAERF
jgi:hypothetical protein